MNPLLIVRDLMHRYSAEVSLSFANLTLDRGELLLVRGPSGSGKSTLLHLLGGVLPIGADAGSASIEGREIALMNGVQRDALRPFFVGWMPQRHGMINSISVLDNVLLPIALARQLTDSDRTRANDLLSALGVDFLALRRPVDISVGQSARVNLARALVSRPKLLLVDEPTAALDEISVSAVAAQLIDYVQAGGCAVVASHDDRLRGGLSAALATGLRERDLSQ